MHNIGTGLVLALATLAGAQELPLAADLEADLASVQKRIPAQRASIRREFGLDTQIERLGASDDDASQDYCERHVHRTCYEKGQHWNRNLDDDVAVFAPSPPGSCKTCAYSENSFGSSRVYNCQTCEPGYEIVVFFADCARLSGNQHAIDATSS